MPTTNTTIPTNAGPVLNAEQVAAGLMTAAGFILSHPDLIDAREHPTVPVTLRWFVPSTDMVAAFAAAAGVTVKTTDVTGPLHTTSEVDFGGLTVGVCHIGEQPRELRRPVTVIPALAEVEAA